MTNTSSNCEGGPSACRASPQIADQSQLAFGDGLPANQFGILRHRSRESDQEALHLVAGLAGKKRELFPGLDAFSGEKGSADVSFNSAQASQGTRETAQESQAPETKRITV